MRTFDRDQFKQSIFEVAAMVACAILILVFLCIFIFIGIQGGRYFLPMQTFEVTTQYFEEDGSSYEQKEFVLSHKSQTELQNSLTQKIRSQFIANSTQAPKISVQAKNELFFARMESGKTQLGYFHSMSYGKELKDLEQVQSTVETLKQDLSNIQESKLRSLHQQINDLNQKDVAKDTPLYLKKVQEYRRWQGHAENIIRQIEAYQLSLVDAQGSVVNLAISELNSLDQPNAFSWFDSFTYSLSQVYVFLTDFPKQASTSGGVFPAIFGTLLMVILMTVVVAPFGTIAAIYLHEYAPDNALTASIRVAVSNMAAVPSVVYGVFGLGFFVYGLGGSIDSLFFGENLPSPTFGTPGLLWAALTMGILTLPVVIVSTEEGLSRVPNNLRAGAHALGATKLESIVKVVVPMASPGILTGIILAIARAAGEVAPLILVGAVKFAPSLPISTEFPFIHLERQFMHLGVFVYDGAFHNQTESQVSSLMFATCMLLLLMVVMLNLSAILLRNKLRNKYERF